MATVALLVAVQRLPPSFFFSVKPKKRHDNNKKESKWRLVTLFSRVWRKKWSHARRTINEEGRQRQRFIHGQVPGTNEKSSPCFDPVSFISGSRVLPAACRTEEAGEANKLRIRECTRIFFPSQEFSYPPILLGEIKWESSNEILDGKIKALCLVLNEVQVLGQRFNPIHQLASSDPKTRFDSFFPSSRFRKQVINNDSIDLLH